MRFSANIGFLWDNLALPERINAAASAGFDAVECHFPYNHEPQEIKQALAENNIPMVGLNTALGPEGYFGVAAIPGEETRARELIDQAVEYAYAIDAANINVVAGLSGENSGNAKSAEATYRSNLQYACEKAASYNKTIVIEPLNPRAVANYHLYTVEQAVETIEAVNSLTGTHNIKMMFDFFHAQIVQGDLETLIRDNIQHFGHVQISAVHDRGEPDRGEINYPYVLQVLESAGYEGYIGAEYKPRGNSVEEGLSWMNAYKTRTATV